MDLSAPAVHIDHISKQYSDGQQALDDVSFVARRGEVTGLLGPNGAGKTTLIRIVTTIVGPTSGTFGVLGFAPDQSIEIRSRVGVMPESAGYPKRKRAADYLDYHGRLHGLMPSVARTGVSRKIEDEKERRRLKRILKGLDVPDGMGVIVRTAGIGATKAELKRDLEYLLLAW